jgi:hypothetical protein
VCMRIKIERGSVGNIMWLSKTAVDAERHETLAELIGIPHNDNN